MYLNPKTINIMYMHNGGYIYYTAIKDFGGGVDVFVNQKFMTKKDALDWCNREHPNVPVNVI